MENRMATGTQTEAIESKMFRLRIGDKVSWNDTSEFPPVQYEGEVKGFDNAEGTYLNVELYEAADEDKKNKIEKVLTEDEVTRVG
jgi:hypothetical protein